MAAFIDPHWYHRLNKSEREEAVRLLSKRMETVDNLRHNVQQATTAPITSNTNGQTTITTASRTSASASSSSKSFREAALTTLFSLSSTNPVCTTMLSTKAFTVQEEIGCYVSSIQKTCSFATFWTENQVKLPLMAAVVRHISNVPATSVPSESSFSVAGYIARKQRSSLSSDAIRYSLVLKYRHHLKLLQKWILKLFFVVVVVNSPFPVDFCAQCKRQRDLFSLGLLSSRYQRSLFRCFSLQSVNCFFCFLRIQTFVKHFLLCY